MKQGRPKGQKYKCQTCGKRWTQPGFNLCPFCVNQELKDSKILKLIQIFGYNKVFKGYW